ncbi:hypothetical protein BC833DRAFT_569109 [Globomyces pollinis-pini]|nr:hypothetical protein BC833DRAFT_569109 [Globomyces pollinis-pini]
MSDEENTWKWDKFVEIGNTIHKIQERQVRIGRAKDGLKFAELLRHSGFLYQSKERYEIYETLIVKIAEYLDGNAKVIQAAVKDYFLFQHGKAGLDQSLFDITFSPKKSGIQTGFTCDVNDGTQSVRYYIKTHQYGPTEDNVKSIKPPDTKELFVYKLLNHIGIGPQTHFIIPSHSTKKTIYIVTKDCHLVLLSNLTKDTANYNALLQLDLISRILCLLGEAAMIVDFRIEKQSRGYVKADILDKFFEGISEFHYSGLMATAINAPYAVKMDVMKKSLQEWKLSNGLNQRLMGWSKDMVARCDLKMIYNNMSRTPRQHSKFF